MAKDYLKKLQALEGACTEDYNPFNRVIRSPSPSVNFTFGKAHGLPEGLTLAMGGYPKGGKSVIANSMIGMLHGDDPDAWAVKFDSEFREVGQMDPDEAAKWGIDRNRYICYSVNSPMLIFDRIETELPALIEDGMKLRLVVIDSVTGIQGRRAMNATTIQTQQIGDEAKTLTDGFKRILPIQRKYKFSVILTCQIRAEMDQLEQMRGNKVKMSLPFAVQHYAEYFMFVEANKNKAGRTDLSGNEFTDESKGDITDGAERTGHKILVKMKDSSVGPKGRKGEFTLSYSKGIINTHEEVYTLAKNRGIITMPNNRTHIFGEKQWTSKEACITAIKEDTELQKAMLIELKKQDMAGKFADVEDDTE